MIYVFEIGYNLTSIIAESFVLASILLLAINNAAEMTDGFVFL